MRILLQFDQFKVSQSAPVPYARVLGFRKEAAPLLKVIQKNSQIPIIGRLSKADALLSSISDQAVYTHAKSLLCQTLYASSLYRLTQEQKYAKPLPTEYEKGLVLV